MLTAGNGLGQTADCEPIMSRRNPFIALLAGATLALALTGPLHAAEDPNAELDKCQRLAETDPVQALTMADEWTKRGGGDTATLCRALGLFHKGDFKTAAGLFSSLAESLGVGSPKSAASLLGRAGWAYMRAGQTDAADRAYTQALAKAPDDPDLHIDRAFARAEFGHYDDAIADLDAALAKTPDRADALVYRAAAYKARKDLPKALADADKALSLKPDDPEGLLLRGNIRVQMGNFDGATVDWRKLAEGPAAGTAEGKAARANLDRLAAARKAEEKAPPAANKPADKAKPGDKKTPPPAK